MGNQCRTSAHLMHEDSHSEDRTSISHLDSLSNKIFKKEMLKLYKEFKNIMGQPTRLKKIREKNEKNSKRNDRIEKLGMLNEKLKVRLTQSSSSC